MAQKKWRGYDEKEAVDHKSLYRDTRTIWQKLTDLFRDANVVAGLGAFCVVIMILFTTLTLPAFAAVCLLSWAYLRLTDKEHLPFYMPAEHEGPDYGALRPGGGYDKAAGMYYFGNEHNTDYELWGRYNDILRHILMFGTTGGGKTEALVSMAYNMLAAGSGFIFVDPKAAPKLQSQIYVLTRLIGRDYDFRTINYLTVSKSKLPGGVSPIRTTNSLNPVVAGNAENLSNMLISLIPKSEGANSIFNQNAQALCRAFMYSWVEKRDAGEIEASVTSIRQRMTLKGCLDFLEDETISNAAKDSMKAFLTSVGWQEGLPLEEQPRSLPEQFGYARGYFGLALNTLTDTYGHIYRPAYGEVDMQDIIRKRRCMVVLLPSLALAPEEIKNLGIITLSSVKNAISIGLGSGQEGVFKDILYTLPTDAPVPFQVITDEYAAIPTPGYIETLTQGRGLGISAIVASQDYAGITKADEAGAQQMLENTFFKFVLKLTSAGKTWELFRDMAGDTVIMETGGLEIKPSQTLSDYRDNLQATVKERPRLHLRDIMEQVEGEFHAFVNGRIVRGYMFYANVPLPEHGQLRINQMVQPFLPEPRTLSAKYGALREMSRRIEQAILENDPIGGEAGPPPDGIERIVEILSDEGRDANDRAIAAFMFWHASKTDEAPYDEFHEIESLPEADVVYDIEEDGGDGEPFGEQGDGVSGDASSPLDAAFLEASEWFRTIEDDFVTAARTAGEPEQVGRRATHHLLGNLHYPKPPTPDKYDTDRLKRNVHTLLERIRNKKHEKD